MAASSAFRSRWGSGRQENRGQGAISEGSKALDLLPYLLLIIGAQPLSYLAYDGLSVSPTTWEPGDVFIQWHTLSIEPTALGGEYQVELGIYSPATMNRLPIYQEGEAVADRLLLSPIQVQARTDWLLNVSKLRCPSQT
jgi:hypothetical protein